MIKQASIALAGLLSAVAVSRADESYHWIQYVPGGLEARAISHNEACPVAKLDGKAVDMAVRSRPGDGYAILVCGIAVPREVKSVSISDVPLAMPVADPKRILLIGDTGCRLKGKVAQACNDIAAWPFRIGSDIGAELKPDLVIHVGDFHYREAGCPIDVKGCAGTPFGDNWDVWRADFFSPAEPLLNAAPWIFVRGNHEECDRGGKGWSRTLDPYKFEDATGCLGLGKPFTVDIGAVQVYVMDVSTADEAKANEKQAAYYKEQFEGTSQLADKPIWLAFHRPIWSAVEVSNAEVEGDNKTLALAAKDSLSKNVQAILSGHQHTFSVLTYDADLPIQIVSGHGGDNLDVTAPRNPIGMKINGLTVTGGIGVPGVFGFSMLERGDSGWSITDYDVHGAKLAKCALIGRKADCK